MHQIAKRGLALLMALIMCIGLLPLTQITADAAEFEYVYNGKYIYNWGTRGDTATSLSPKAEEFYTNTTYTELSQLSGGTSTSDAPNSALYSALQKLMKDAHSNVTSYDATRDLYQYTDCQNSGKDSKAISSFYSGDSIGPAWDGGSTWNREHTWPNSKGDAAGNGENDIMMLRPAAKDENGSRGNKAYGESSGYYYPNTESNDKLDVRGDVARIVLYVYVRWGCINTGSSYNPNDIVGTAGVIESLEVLLKWMAADPVDTWELGRNDSVQAITGTRNVFVDYPELAFLLFGADMPANMPTPSGEAKNADTCQHNYVAGTPVAPTCTEEGYTVYTCSLCTKSYKGDKTPATGHTYVDGTCTGCGKVKPAGTNMYIYYPAGNKYISATATGNRLAAANEPVVWNVEIGDDGYYTFAVDGQYMTSGATGNSLSMSATLTDCGRWEAIECSGGIYLRNVGANYNGNYNQCLEYYSSAFTTYGLNESNASIYTFQLINAECQHTNTETLPGKDATCGEPGLTEGKKCTDCGATLTAQQEIPATGEHTYVGGVCTGCGKEEPTGTEATITFDDVAKRTQFNDNIQVWQENGITVTNEKAASTNPIADYSKPARFYQGSSLKIEFPGMTKIVFNCNNYKDTYAAALKDSIGNVSGVTVTVNGTVVTVEFAQAQDSLAIAKMTAQARVDSITVYAAGGETPDPECQHTNTTVEGAIPATCTTDGHTGKTVCVDCGVTTDEGEAIPATGHNYVGGTCTGCGEADPDAPVAPEQPATNKADFNTIVLPSNKQNGDSSYTNTYETEAGWVTVYSAIQTGGTTVMNPQFPVIGPDNTYKAPCLNGKTSAPGKITSPTLTGGISKLTMNYTKMFTDTKLSVTITITDLATGQTYTQVVEREEDKDTKYVVWTYEWVLEEPITGDFTIEVVNNCPSQSTSNKDRFTILELAWESAPVKPATSTSTYVMSEYKVDGELGGGEFVRELDDVLTFTISSGWFTSEARVYKNANGIFASKKAISVLVVNAGYKDSTFDVYTSEDGQTWTLYQEDVAYISGYSDVTITFDTPVKYIKLDAPNAQLRIKTVTITFVEEGGSTEPVCQHTNTTVEGAVPATCTTDGHTGKTVCADCGETISEGEVIPAAHTEETVSGKDATCTEAGLTDGVKCSVCGVVLKEQEEIPATGHTEEPVPGKDATCTEAGLTDGVKCSGCGVVLKEQEEIPATGHNYEAVVTEPTCNLIGYTTHTCAGCGDSYVTDEVRPTGHLEENREEKPYVAPTRTEAGYTAGVYCNGCGTYLYGHEQIPALGYTVRFIVPATVTAVAPITGTTVVLPAAEAPAGFAFEGWVTEPVKNSQEQPAVYTAGETFSVDDDDVLYALYSYETAETTAIMQTSGENSVYQLVTDATQLVVGKNIVIVAAKENYAMSTTQNGNNRASVAIVKNADNTVTWTTAVQVFQLVAGSKADTYGFYTGSGYLYAASSSKNYLRTQNNLDANASWTITVTSAGVATVKAQGSNSRNWMRFNTSNSPKLFACYSSGQTDIALYIETEIAAPPSNQIVYTTVIGNECAHENTHLDGVVAATCTTNGNTGDLVCDECDAIVSKGEAILAQHIWTEATCMNAKICGVCGETSGEPLAHTPGQELIENAVAADCVTDGSYDKVHYCTICGEEASRETVPVPTTGHTPSEPVIENESAADCVNAGSYDSVVYCSVCKAEISRETVPVLATGHDYQAVVTAPTCGENGYTTYTCSVCGDSYVADEVPATGAHTFGAWNVLKAATCTEDGMRTRSCVCGASQTEMIAATGVHAYSAWTETKDATCTAAGEKTRSCYCGDVQTAAIAALGHTEVVDAAVAATCTTAGKTEGKHCDLCNEVLTAQEEIPALGHSEVTDAGKAATCTTAGKTEGEHCSVCGEVLVAQEVIAATGHSFGDWKVSKEASRTEAGEETRSCACGETETREIPALGGVNPVPVVIVVVAGLGAVAVVAFVFMKKKRA